MRTLQNVVAVIARVAAAMVLVAPAGATTGWRHVWRCVEITRTYVAAFLDLHPRHRPQPLLDGPSSRFPEVDFVDPTA